MALGTTNISTTAVGTEIGVISNVITDLVGAVSLNPYSFYGPGFLSVDVNKDVVITPPVDNFKLGDFRSYDHTSETPHAQADCTLNWGPGGVEFNSVISWFPNGMNIKEFAVSGDYVTFSFYSTVEDRVAGTNVVHSFTTTILFNDITPLVGHTRTTNKRANSTQTPMVTGIPTTYATLYCDTFISDISGTRLINLGTKTNGYTTITLVENELPYVYGFNNSGSPVCPEHYTFISARIYGTPGLPCAENTVNQSLGTTYSFNLAAYGLYNDGEGVNEFRTIRLPICYAKLTVDGNDTILMDGEELADTGQYFTGELTAGTFNYNDQCKVIFTTGTTVDGADFVSCP